MSDILEMACDICSHKYRLAGDRMGTTARCRECGTTFEVCEHNRARPEEEEEESDPVDNPWLWVRGTLVGMTILLIVVGLSVLPFYHPDRSAVQAGLSVPGSGAVPGTGFPGSAGTGAAPWYQPPGSPQPHGIVVQQAGPGGQIQPGFSPPQTQPSTSSGFDPATQLPGPDITGLELERTAQGANLIVNGSGLLHAIKVVCFTIPLGVMSEPRLRVVSDQRLEVFNISQLLDRGYGVLVLTKSGRAVTVPSNVAELPGELKPVIVAHGTIGEVSVPNVVFVDRGATCTSTVNGLYFVAEGATLRSPSVPQHLYVDRSGLFLSTKPRTQEQLTLKFCYVSLPVNPP